MGGHIKGDPVQGEGGEGHGAIVLSPPQTERVVKEVVSKQFKSRT